MVIYGKFNYKITYGALVNQNSKYKIKLLSQKWVCWSKTTLYFVNPTYGNLR